MKKILIMVLITLTFNINASSVYEGKWYKFTDDFIRNCFDGFEETQESVNESSGKTSSFANSITRKELSDCLSGTPYLDTDPQVNPRDFGGNNSCQAIYRASEKMNLPSAANGQTVELTSTDGKITAKYKCSNGNWGSSFNKVDSRSSQNNCSSACLKWDSSGNVSTCSSISQISGNVGVCGSILLEKAHGKTLRAISQSNYFSGNAQFYCNNGSWNLISGTASCESQTCAIGAKVAWSDKDFIASNTSLNANGDSEELEPLEVESSSNSRTLSELRHELSYLSANGGNVDEIVEEIINYDSEDTVTSHSEDVGSSVFEDPFEESAIFREKPKCIAEVISVDGITGTASFIKEDKRIFSSVTEAIDNHKNMIGNANVQCVKGKWVVDNATANCRINTSVNCNRTRVLGIQNGVNILGYFCE